MLIRTIALGLSLLLTVAALAAPPELVVVVSRDSPIKKLTSAELNDIFLGRLKQMPPGHPVLPIDQQESAPARKTFYESYLNRTLAQIRAHWSRLIFIGRGTPPHAVASSAAVAKLVANNANAIGYIEPSQLSDKLRVVDIE